MTFLSTSAKTGDNVEDAFVTLARSILQAGQGRPSSDGAKSHRLYVSVPPPAVLFFLLLAPNVAFSRVLLAVRSGAGGAGDRVACSCQFSAVKLLLKRTVPSSETAGFFLQNLAHFGL